MKPMDFFSGLEQKRDCTLAPLTGRNSALDQEEIREGSPNVVRNLCVVRLHDPVAPLEHDRPSVRPEGEGHGSERLPVPSCKTVALAAGS